MDLEYASKNYERVSAPAVKAPPPTAPPKKINFIQRTPQMNAKLGAKPNAGHAQQHYNWSYNRGRGAVDEPIEKELEQLINSDGSNLQ